MPNPGSFPGARGEFLKSQCDLYAEAVRDGHIADTVADIQRRYFLRWPVTLAHDEEQTQEWLDSVDDSAVEEEMAVPNVDGTSPEEAAQVLNDYHKLVKELKTRKESIKRRMQYMHSKANADSSGGKKIDDLLDIMISRLTGVDIKVPRMKTAFNVWGPLHRDLVDPIFNARVKEKDIPASQQISLRSAIYKELFAEQPREIQEKFNKRAIREHEKAVREARKKTSRRASTKPYDRQMVISNVAKVAEPILDLLAEYTGFRFSMLAGGPEPADGGRLNMICIHSGYLGGSVKMDFGRAERIAFKEVITPAFGRFLKRSYTIEECRSRALPKEDSDDLTLTLAASVPELDEDDDSITTHRFAIDQEHVDASHSTHRAQGKRLFESLVQKPKKTPNPPPAGTPSPRVRMGPPVGKQKQRELPSKDKSGHRNTAPIKPSPLSQVVTSPSSSSGALTSGPVAGLQVPVAESVGNGKNITSVVPAQPTPVPVASRPPSPAPPRPASPVPSRPAALIPSRPASPVPSRPATPVQSRPGSPVPSRPATPVPSRPASPVLSHPATPVPSRPGSSVPSRPATPVPSRPASPVLSRPATPVPSRPGSPVPSRPPTPVPSRPARALSHLASPPPVTVTTVQTTPPSGTATVPDLSSITNLPPKANQKRVLTGEGENSDSTGAKCSQTSVATKKRKARGGARPVAKKQRVASGSAPTSPAFAIDVPADMPEWASGSLDLLTRQDLGPQWQLLVVAWLKMEDRAEYVEHAKLPPKWRPQEVGEWIKRHRTSGYTPTIANVDKFGQKFTAWWTFLQPGWRSASGQGALKRGGTDWSTVRKCSTGANGLISVLYALFLWGSATLTYSQRGVWDAAVDDVLYVIQQLA